MIGAPSERFLIKEHEMEAKYSRDNIFVKVMTIVYQLMILNVLFIVFSLPVLTIGASLKALTGCVRDMIQGELSSEIRTFFSYFKEKFIQTTLSFVFLAIGFGVVLFNFSYIKLTGPVIGILQILVFVQLLLTQFMISYVLLEWDFPLFKSLRIAWIIGNKNMIQIIGCAGIGYLMLKLSLRIPILVIFFMMPLTGMLKYWFCYPLIRKLKGEHE